MNIRKRILALCIILVLCSVSCAGAFYDVLPEDWFFSYINRASELGIMQGYENMAMPDDSLTKEQCIAMLQRCLDSGESLIISDESVNLLMQAGFSEWAYESGAYGFESGILQPGDFVPSNAAEPAERLLIAKWISKALHCSYMPFSVLRYQDSSSVSGESMKYIDAMYRYGIMRGDNSNPYISLINSGGSISRAEFAKISTMLYEMRYALPENCMENSIVNITGKIISADSSNNMLKLNTEEGTAFIKIEDEISLLINGVESSFSALEALSGKLVCIGSAAGSQTVCVSSEIKVCTGELTEITEYSDYTALFIDGTVYYTDGESTGYPCTGTVTFIAEGVHIIEIE